jgi:hypothetical protein
MDDRFDDLREDLKEKDSREIDLMEIDRDNRREITIDKTDKMDNSENSFGMIAAQFDMKNEKLKD